MTKRQAMRFLQENMKHGITKKEFLHLCCDFSFWFDVALEYDLDTIYYILRGEKD